MLNRPTIIVMLPGNFISSDFSIFFWKTKQLIRALLVKKIFWKVHSPARKRTHENHHEKSFIQLPDEHILSSFKLLPYDYECHADIDQGIHKVKIWRITKFAHLGVGWMIFRGGFMSTFSVWWMNFSNNIFLQGVRAQLNSTRAGYSHICIKYLPTIFC